LTEKNRAFRQALLLENTREKEVLAKHRTEYRNQGKEYHEGDSQIKDQTLYATSCLKDRACTTTAESAAQTCSSYLEQDEEDNGNTENDLHYAECWKPLGHDIFLTFVVHLINEGDYVSAIHCTRDISSLIFENSLDVSVYQLSERLYHTLIWYVEMLQIGDSIHPNS